MNPIIILLLIILYITFLPITSLFYIILPKSKIGKFMSLPCIKFITHLTSYLFFIILVISSYFVEEQDPVNFLNHFPKYNQSFANYTSGCFSYMVNFENFYIRETKPTVLDFIISFWVIGQTWHELKKLFVLGIYDYMRSSSNTFSFTMNVFYITAYGLRFYMSECAMAIANLLAFIRLSFYLAFNQKVGPLQITLGKMINVSIKKNFKQ